MSKKIFSLCSILILITTVMAAAPTGKSVEEMAMFAAKKFDAHYRTPNEAGIENLLKEDEVIPQNAPRAQVESSAQTFLREFNQRNPDTPNPIKLRELLNREALKDTISTAEAQAVESVEPQIMSLVVPVEFKGEDTFDWCGETVTWAGPLHNEVLPPGERDNNTLWYDDTTPELYEELYFGVGPQAGVFINHPNLGTVDLRGSTMANYYLEQSEGKFTPKGAIYPSWLQAAHSEGWYGQDSCDGGSHNTRAHELVVEVIDLINAEDASFNWQGFDGNADGVVDNFTVIHAGEGQEGGGGAQGDFSIWSHASMIGWPNGYLVCSAGAAGCPDRDIRVREYSMDPEHIDVGVISEEFGHAAFGLPDMYTTDYQGSISNWAIMEAGSWNGPIAGMMPAPFPLWFRYLIGWVEPMELDYTDAARVTVVGQHSLRPDGTEAGLKINLPDREVSVPNPLGSGNAWWSDVGDGVQHTLAGHFDLTAATAPIFSFNSHWSIEEGWDYGYVEVSADNGMNWTSLPDMDGILTDQQGEGNSNNEGWGLTGEGQGLLRFDLTAYYGKAIDLRLRYSTDAAVQIDGWWADDFKLADGEAVLFSDDVEASTSPWTSDGWRVTPLSNTFPRYYLVEWRNKSGFDRGLAYAYHTVYNGSKGWEVDRNPYTVPGMLLYYRDASYALDYTLGDSWYDAPSYGPKHGILAVDSHPFPYGWDSSPYASGAQRRLSVRTQPADATFTLQNTTPFTLRLGLDYSTGQYVDGDPLEVKTFGPRPAESQFHDSLGYYPGLYFANGGLYFWQVDSGLAIPAKEDYTTRITDLNNDPLFDLYGYDLGDTLLGSGNPGDDGVQFGLHVAVVGKAKNGSWGAIATWNSNQVTDLSLTVNRSKVKTKGLLKYTLELSNKTPIPQRFVLDDPIPEETTFVLGRCYNPTTKSIHYSGLIGANGKLRLTYIVKVNKDVPVGTVIKNTATVTDDALGDTATFTSKVVK